MKRITLFVLAALISVSSSGIFSHSASAISAQDWRAGNIIDDALSPIEVLCL